jgi:hypothetical protein
MIEYLAEPDAAAAERAAAATAGVCPVGRCHAEAQAALGYSHRLMWNERGPPTARLKAPALPMSPEDEDAVAGIISKLVGDGTLTQLTAEKAG